MEQTISRVSGGVQAERNSVLSYPHRATSTRTALQTPTLRFRLPQAGEWEPWILYMLTAVEKTAMATCEKVHAIRALIEQTRQRVQSELPKIYSRELVDAIFGQPYCRINFLVNAGIAARKAASLNLRKLADIGILERHQAGREVIYLNPELLAVLKR